MNDVASRAGVFALALVLAACASTGSPMPAPASQPAASATPAVAPEAEPRHPLAVTEPCPLDWEPGEVGSVLRIPAEVIARPLRPVVAAACRCVRPGEDVRVVANIDFTAGRVVADAPDAPEVAQCLDQVPLPTFEPWSAGGVSDCIDCGPRRYGVFRGSPRVDAHVESERLRVVYPLRVDRSAETPRPDPAP